VQKLAEKLRYVDWNKGKRVLVEELIVLMERMFIVSI